ncbi:MAG TPA: hypothetical protein VKU02_14315 [Gemmataceae bacterium]|nr:hypothetical protein [Gemmataceae bacterium]
MYSCAKFAVTLSLLAAFLVLTSGVPWGIGPVQGQTKDSDSDVPKELTPKTITLQETNIPLSKALRELATQTGNQVEDRRREREDIKLSKIGLKNATFWQALDTIAKTADAKVSLYERDGKIALLDGPHQVMPVSYSGLFRVAIKGLHLHHLLDADAHYCDINLEVAWEPRFQPLLMETRPDSLTVQDDKGRDIEIPESGKGPAAIGRPIVKTIDLRIPAPQRSAKSFSLLKGKLAVMGPIKMLTFTFDQLSKIEKANEARKETKEGVTIHLRELRSEGGGGDEVWTVGLLLEYPPDGPKFESFQSWIINNQLFLEREQAGIKQRFPPNLGYETDDQSDTKAIIRYRFGDEPEKKLTLGKFSDWRLVYRTPGRIVEVPVPFEFKDVSLP